jgi:hypothetical protein
MKPNIALSVLTVGCLASATFAAVNVQQNPDGTTYTGVMVNGDPAAKYDIVFIGDGFTLAEQDKFNSRVNMAVNALWNLAPFSSHMCALNIWRVNVVSADSGVDHPIEGIYKDTELDCTYGDNMGTPERCIGSNSPVKCWEAAGHAPVASNCVFVLVNDEQWGGCAGGLVFSSISISPRPFSQIITHELGHKIGSLADEYPYWYSKDDPPSTYTGSEPSAVNATTKTTYAQIKWNAFINPATPLPTLSDFPAGVVGLFEGAKYHSHGIYRPQFICQMRDSAEEFCAVCKKQMDDRLQLHENEETNWICDGTLRRLLALINRRYIEKWRFPIPPCLTCPPHDFLMDEVIYVLEGLPGGFQLKIKDDLGQTVFEQTSTGKQIMAGFDAHPARTYFVDVVGSEDMIGQDISMMSQLFRNGVEQELPQGM